jgi:RNA polymerase sigma-70 factor (ECF subfamily)
VIRDDLQPRFEVDAATARRVVEEFAAACASGDVAALAHVLAPDAVGEFDSGGRIAGAPLVPQVGAELVALTLAHAFSGSSAVFVPVDVNGEPGVHVRLHDRVMAVISVETDGEAIVTVRGIGNPLKLAHLNPGTP